VPFGDSIRATQSPCDSLEPRFSVNPACTLFESAASSVPAEDPQHDESSYHGPTGVSFGEAVGEHDTMCKENNRLGPDAEFAKCKLFAESAKQREYFPPIQRHLLSPFAQRSLLAVTGQLEAVNLSSGCLDFDGLEPSLAMDLLSIFWSRQLHTGLLVYRTVFMRDMACAGKYFSKLLLNAIYYSASKHCSATSIRRDAGDKATAGWAFRKTFTDLLRNEFDKTSIPTIQALLVMANSLFSRCDERSTSWLYIGIAINMLIDSGIHAQHPAEGKRDEDFEIRRRIFWSAFSKLIFVFEANCDSLSKGFR
jgi:hypothetical protein